MLEWDKSEKSELDYNKIVSDKLITVSTKNIFYNVEDFIDLYSITLNKDCKIETSKVQDYIKLKKYGNMTNDIGEFIEFFKMKDEIYKCILKMKKPALKIHTMYEFSKMYDRIVKFCMPFIYRTSNNCIWDVKEGRWI